ncbi:MAG: hypothetical protein QM796_14945 [Chthoniobacteraceae bacterium]
METRSIEAIIKALNDAGIEYLVVGGLAVNAHGFVRLTRDVDLVIRLESKNIERGLNCLFEIGYQIAIPVEMKDVLDPEMRAVWKREKQMLVLKLWSDRHQRTPIDIFIYEPFEFTAERAQAMLQEVAPGVEAAFLSLPALLQMKREAGRPQDLLDIEELIRVQ